MERSLKVIYFSLISLAPLLDLFYALVLLAANKYLELALINICGIAVAFSINFLLQRILKRKPALAIYVREMIWILIAVLGLTAFGGFGLSGISVTDILSLVSPVSLLGAVSLAFLFGVNSLARIHRWERIGLRSPKIRELLEEIEEVFQDVEHGEISWAYNNTPYLSLLFVTQQMNLALIVISDIFEKLVSESFKILKEPIPKDEDGLAVGYPKRAMHLGLNLELNDSSFDFGEFWKLRGKYVHGAIERTVEIVPSEEEIEKSIRLLSKTLREYPSIMRNLRHSLANGSHFF